MGTHPGTNRGRRALTSVNVPLGKPKQLAYIYEFSLVRIAVILYTQWRDQAYLGFLKGVYLRFWGTKVLQWEKHF